MSDSIRAKLAATSARSRRVGTLGTLAGGVLAERVATLTSPQGLLVLLGVLQLACALTLFRFTPATAAPEAL